MDTNKIDTPTLIVIVILLMGLINGMMSCTSSQAVYKQKDGKYEQASKTSQVTGWNYSTIK